MTVARGFLTRKDGDLWSFVCKSNSELSSSQPDMDISIAFGFAKGICSGMDHLHSEGVLHCDLAAR